MVLQEGLAFCYFMGRFTLSGEPPPNVTDRISFRENHVFPAQTDKSAPLPADILWKETKALLRALGINTTNVFHAFRKSGIQNVETAGVDQQDLQRFGQWNQNRWCDRSPQLLRTTDPLSHFSAHPFSF